MSKFCGTCGSTLNEAQKFCGKCGSPNSAVPQTTTTLSPESAAPTAMPSYAPVPQGAAAPSPAPGRSNALLKVGLAVIVVLFVGGLAAAGAVYYAVHKVKEKVQATMHKTEEDSPSEIASLLQKAAAGKPSGASDEGHFQGDPCRFLSPGEVSSAVGVAIVRVEARDEGCTYIAKGDPADMVSKHMTSMISSQAKSNGTSPTPEQTKLMQQITGAFFKQSESADKDLSKEAASGEVPILVLTFSTGNADVEMKLNRMAFNHVKASAAEGATTDQAATGDLDGIGDDAYEVGGSGFIFRKGQTVVHMMFTECPCDAKAVKPLAVRLASQL